MQSVEFEYMPFYITDIVSTYSSRIKLTVTGSKIRGERTAWRVYHNTGGPNPPQHREFEFELPYECVAVIKGPMITTIVLQFPIRQIATQCIVFMGKGKMRPIVLNIQFHVHGDSITPRLVFEEIPLPSDD